MSVLSDRPRRPAAASAIPADRSCGSTQVAPILILDRHQLVGFALCTALRSAGHAAHPLPVTSQDRILTTAAGHPSGLVLVEPVLGVDGQGQRIRPAQLVAALTAQGNPVLVLTARIEVPLVAAVIAAGALGVVPKAAPFATLLGFLAAAAAGRPLMTEGERSCWLDRYQQHRQHSRERMRLLRRLTPREREVLELLATGHRPAAIATQFVTALATVRTQIRAVLIKLEVTSQLEAVAFLLDTSVDPVASYRE
jgi:DNA-binding NarL/FixJ family response regulator